MERGKFKVKIPVTQLRVGTVFVEEGTPFLVLEYRHVNLGRGTANIKVKVRNLRTGAVLRKTFLSGRKVEKGELEEKEAQFLYRDGKGFYFMDVVDFSQFQIEEIFLERKGKFLKEGGVYRILFFEEKPLVLQLPAFLEFVVKETGPGVRGDSETNIFKKAVLENGLVVSVPLFIKKGERIKIDTRTGEYKGRVVDVR